FKALIIEDSDSYNLIFTVNIYTQYIQKFGEIIERNDGGNLLTINLKWVHGTFHSTFEQAERKRLELIQLKKLGPDFYEKYHSKAIYTSRALSSLISRSSTKLSSIISFNSFNAKQAAQDTFNSQNQNGIYISRPLSVTKDSSRKRNFEELKIETQKNSKHFKADNSYEELY
ncbi:19920_t:CDS:2, partial [Rhizophagus irregularis]